MNIKIYKQNYPDLEKFFDFLQSYPDFDITFENDRIIINYKPYRYSITIHESQLTLLEQSEKAIGIPSLRYLDTYGFKFKKYHEICLQIEHPGYSFFDGSNEWKAEPLKFKIDSVEFQIGPVSPLLVLLMEPVFSIRKYYLDFKSFSSIKMIVENHSDFKNQFNKALYYLNSHYLKKIGFHASIRHLEISEEDPLGIFYTNNIEDVFKEATRKRIRHRKNFIRIEPLALYNHAQSKNDEQKFLLLYRIFEFFMGKAKIFKLEKLRYDKSISEKEIIDIIDLRNEEKQLENLFDEAISPSNKKKFTDFCFHHKLIPAKKFIIIHKELYKFRNSIVHAKESEVDITIFPDPFADFSDIHRWIYVVDEIARMCINKYNITSS